MASAANTRAVPADILAAIHEHGSHPFLSIRIPEGIENRVLLCSTQLEGKDFSRELASISTELGGSPLLDAIRFVLEYELYDAAFAFFDWIHQPKVDAKAIIYLFDSQNQPFDGYWGHPIIDLCAENERTPLDRGEGLARLFDTLDDTSGNDEARGWFLRALAFALSRHFGSIGEYDAGLLYVDRAIPRGDQFRYLATCKHVLGLKKAGHPVPKRLEKFAGQDQHALRDRTCPHPYREFQVHPSGEVYICCASLVPISLGNVVADDVEAVLNSDTAHKIRRSVVDGSFRYCDHLNCSWMVRGLPGKNQPEILADPVMRAALKEEVTHVDAIRDLTFAYDYSCNLSCPSCRRDIMAQKESAHVTERSEIADKFLPLLPKLDTLYMNPAGEFLASRPSRQLLLSVDGEACTNLKISLISNGTLFSEREWQKFSNVHKLIHSVRISADAASETTFEAIRRGGKWSIFAENVRFIGRLRNANLIKEFLLAFTYQVGNFREMRIFVAFARAVGADLATFQRLDKTDAMTDAEYLEAAVHRREHPLHAEFLEVIDHEIFTHIDVQTDFEYGWARGGRRVEIERSASNYVQPEQVYWIGQDAGQATERITGPVVCSTKEEKLIELDFRTASVERIVEIYFDNGCVLLRNFAEPPRLASLARLVDKLYETIDDIHIYPGDLRLRGIPPFHDAIFETKHHELLGRIFHTYLCRVAEETASRRIDVGDPNGQWMEPLGPHLDAFFHPFEFTVNFWVPFRQCGLDAPSLGVVRSPFEDVLRFAGYRGGPAPHGPPGTWNFARFSPEMYAFAIDEEPQAAVDRLRERFHERVLTPRYAFGDALMLSNWTLHFTHAAEAMTRRCGNVELRFISDATLTDILARHGRTLSSR